MNTRRYPRTMAEAFGPYTSHRLESMAEQPRRGATRLYAAILVVTLVLTIIAGVPS